VVLHQHEIQLHLGYEIFPFSVFSVFSFGAAYFSIALISSAQGGTLWMIPWRLGFDRVVFKSTLPF